jgi:hypothetical protein
MLDSNSELDETRDLKGRIVVSLQQLKAFHLTISAVMIDLAALRETVLTTPEMKSRYKKNLARAAKKSRPLVQEAMRSYDDLIHSTLEDGTPAGNPSPVGMNIH